MTQPSLFVSRQVAKNATAGSGRVGSAADTRRCAGLSTWASGSRSRCWSPPRCPRCGCRRTLQIDAGLDGDGHARLPAASCRACRCAAVRGSPGPARGRWNGRTRGPGRTPRSTLAGGAIHARRGDAGAHGIDRRQLRLEHRAVQCASPWRVGRPGYSMRVMSLA